MNISCLVICIGIVFVAGSAKHGVADHIHLVHGDFIPPLAGRVSDGALPAPESPSLARPANEPFQFIAQPAPRNYPYIELEGKVEEFRFIRNWRAYYWRQDCTLLVRDDAGKLHRVISREPTPWAGHRLGTTYTGLAVDWTKQPRVQIIGVQAIDRVPEDFYDVKLDAKNTVTAFILRVQDADMKWQDFYINNWFHRWGDDTDRKILKHYANDKPNYTVYGYYNGIAAPFDAAGKALMQKYSDANIYHGRVVAAKNDIGYEVRILHLLGRDKKTSKYEIFHGDPRGIEKLDGVPPPK